MTPTPTYKYNIGDYVYGKFSHGAYKILRQLYDNILSESPYYLAEVVGEPGNVTYISEVNAIPLSESEVMAIRMGAKIEKES